MIISCHGVSESKEEFFKYIYIFNLCKMSEPWLQEAIIEYLKVSREVEQRYLSLKRCFHGIYAIFDVMNARIQSLFG